MIWPRFEPKNVKATKYERVMPVCEHLFVIELLRPKLDCANTLKSQIKNDSTV